MNISCRYALVMSVCGAMSFGIASQPVVPVAQIQKELSAEKAQWAYVQKVLTDDLQLSKTVINKLHRVGAYGAGVIGGVAAESVAFLSVLAFGEATKLFSPDSSLIQLVCICGLGGASGLAGAIWLANAVDKLLENKPAVYAKALSSFVSKWPEHKVQAPQSLQETFDALYAKRQVKNGGLTDKQSQALVEGILALSVVAQVI
ncbi:MAG: hypothetical protein WC365_02315 [Candidatus Babeliales bacterium]|jgi:hypothetical protein